MQASLANNWLGLVLKHFAFLHRRHAFDEPTCLVLTPSIHVTYRARNLAVEVSYFGLWDRTECHVLCAEDRRKGPAPGVDYETTRCWPLLIQEVVERTTGTCPKPRPRPAQLRVTDASNYWDVMDWSLKAEARLLRTHAPGVLADQIEVLSGPRKPTHFSVFHWEEPETVSICEAE